MKKILFFWLLMPILTSAEDSILCQKILENSIHKMDRPCQSIEYILAENRSNNKLKEEYYYKIIYDTNAVILQAWCGINKDSKGFEREIYRNKLSDTTYRYERDFDLLYIYPFQTYDLPNCFNGYFKETIEHVKRSLEQKVDTSYLKHVFLTYQGLENIHGTPHYVIQEYSEYQMFMRLGTSRTLDDKIDMYETNNFIKYYFIDTCTYWVNKQISFSISNKQDTIGYSNSELLNCKFNNFDSIEFHPGYLRKIISYFINPEDSCERIQNVKDLQGKGPNIKGITNENKPFELYQQKAKCYILDFMFTTCGVCVSIALPFWKEMKGKYDSPDIQYLAIDPIDDLDKIKAIVKKYKINFPVIQDKQASRNYAISSYPSCYILDENFNIILSITGFTDCDKPNIERILSSYYNQTKK